MTPEIPPIVTEETRGEQRKGERREGWHTPETCFKLLDVRQTMDSIFGQLAAGGKRMNCIESKLDENTKATNELLEIIQMGKGFFRTLGFIGKWARRVILWVAPVVTAVVSLWYTVTQKPH